MEVILLEKIRNLGDIGDKVNVKAGYSRNFLLPQGKAITATPANLAKFEQRRAELEGKAKEILDTAKARAEKLAKIEITIPMRASEEGKLFGSVGVREIVEAITATGEEIDKKEVAMPEGPIHSVGTTEIVLQLHSDVEVPINITVAPE